MRVAYVLVHKFAGILIEINIEEEPHACQPTVSIRCCALTTANKVKLAMPQRCWSTRENPHKTITKPTHVASLTEDGEDRKHEER